MNHALTLRPGDTLQISVTEGSTVVTATVRVRFDGALLVTVPRVRRGPLDVNRLKGASSVLEALSTGAKTVGAIVSATQRRRRDVERALRLLIKRGLAVDAGGVFRAAPPDAPQSPAGPAQA